MTSPSLALNKPASLTPSKPPVQPPAAIATPAHSLRRQPSNANRKSDTLIELLLGIIAVVVLFGLIETATRNAHSTSLMAMSTSDPIANGTAAMGGVEKVATDYTTFNTVIYRSWKVITGWKFADSRTAQPDRQYCYLEVLTIGGHQMYSIEERVPVERHDMPEALIPGLDKAAWDEAATKCVWRR